MELKQNKLIYIYLIIGLATLIGLNVISGYILPLLLGVLVSIITAPIFNMFMTSTVKLHWKSFLNIFYKRKSEVDPNSIISALMTVLTTLGVIVLSVYLVGLFAGNNLKFIFNEPLDKQAIELIQNPTFKDKFGQFYNEEDLKKRITTLYEEYRPTNLINNARITQSKELQGTALSVAQKFFKNASDGIIFFIVFIFTWIIMLISGKDLLNFMYKFTPFSDEEKTLINQDVSSGVNNVIIGNVVSGLLIALGVAIIGLTFGVKLVAVWSTLAFFIGFLPLSPSELGFAPVLIGILFNQGLTTFLIVAVVIEIYILILNNFVLPKITAGKETNPLLILVSVFSGISIFGVFGFIVGPVFVYLMMALYRIASNRIDLLNLESKN
ncbi:MAG: AI-2E family transporter [Patescibacteria group bacterium]